MNRILRLRLNATLMHCIYQITISSRMDEALGGSHHLEGPTLRIASASNSLRCIRFPLSGKHWDKELVDDCYVIGFNPVQLLALARALAPNHNWNAITRHGCVTLQGIPLCVFVLLYVTVYYV